jgi:hypothetical protein
MAISRTFDRFKFAMAIGDSTKGAGSAEMMSPLLHSKEIPHLQEKTFTKSKWLLKYVSIVLHLRHDF